VNLAQYAPSPKQVLWGLGGAIVVSGVLAGVVYARTNIPTPSTIASQQNTVIYYSDGKPLATIGSTNRTDVPLSKIPLTVQHAVLAAEDRHFYSEPGVSPTGIVRALAVDIHGGDISQGGSTITQQYAKNAYLSDHRSLTRKLKEIVIATKLGQTKSKATILDDYLNTIYFGRNAYGIQAAAQAYFKENVGQLTIAQGALLATVVRGPTVYDPHVSATARDNAIARWHYVINGMVTEGWLTQAKAATLTFPKSQSIHDALQNQSQTQCNKGAATCYIRDAVEHELLTQDGLSEAQLELGGYKIMTTINQKAETAMIAAEHNVLTNNNTGTPESGAASVVPNTGAIAALYGGRHYCHDVKKDKNSCIDLSGATDSWGRPGGSSFKAFTLIAALQQGKSLNSTFNGPYTVKVNGTEIHNASPGETCYGCTLTKAFAQSVNTIFVPLAQSVGPDKVVAAAYKAGIPESAKLQAVPDISLGPDDISAVDLADAYATIAANGVHEDPYLVQSVTSPVFSKAVTSNVIYAMQKVLQPGGTADGHALSGRPSAGKTGTTDANTNAWFTGFTPQLCTSVWIGNVDRNKTVEGAGVGEVFGGTLPAEIWQQTMNAALTGKPVLPFPTPAQIGTTTHASTSATPSTTPTKSPSGTPTPTLTPTPTPTPTPTLSPTITPVITPTITPVTTPTATSHKSPAAGTGDAARLERRRRRTH
jgi:membrane peptidoglycan carboxypeptidase